MTNIQFLKNRIIIDGHADTKQECETITLLCDNLAKSKDFKTVRYESGYAEFEKVGKTEELKFVSAPTEDADITLVWDSGITSVTGVPNETGGSYTWTTSNTAKTVTAIFGDYETITYTPVLKDGYVIDTVTTNNDGSNAADTINIADDKKSFTVSLLYPNQYATITITTKQSGSSDNLTWVINETPTTEPLSVTEIYKVYNINFTSNGRNFENIAISNERVPGKLTNLANIIYNNGLSSTESVYYSGIWENEAYRTIKFETAPAGELLQWLQANATQGSSTTKQQIDLSTLSGWANLSSGQHSITVKAKASGYADSASSNAVSVEKAASGHAVTITAAAGSYGVKIYDGTSSSGTLLGTVNDDATGSTAQSKIVNCSSGNLYLISDNGAYTDANTVVTGGVTIVSEGSYNYDGTFKVTADGTITISLACLIEGTQITLADGSTKAVEDITYDDELLVWNFYEGKFDIAKPTWIKVAEVAPRYNLVKFSNGAEVGFVGAGGEKGYHRIFNKEAGAFTHTGCADTPNGTTTFAQDETFPTVVSQEVVEKEVKFYNVITDKHYNLFANGILTSCKLSNKYRIEDMRYIGERLISDEQVKKYFERIKQLKMK